MNVQYIRLIDVFVIAPLLIYVGFKYKMPNYIKWSLILIGIFTLIYNLSNYIKTQKLAQ